MTPISIQEIERDPLAFVHRIKAGEPLLIVRGDIAIAEIQPLSPAGHPPRPFGLAAGEFTVPDDFDQPLPDEMVKLFEGA
jgi:antitoxin (DNA-binding transcriptional repressor) of toxin-antitoxin stability system